MFSSLVTCIMHVANYMYQRVTCEIRGDKVVIFSCYTYCTAAVENIIARAIPVPEELHQADNFSHSTNLSRGGTAPVLEYFGQTTGTSVGIPESNSVAKFRSGENNQGREVQRSTKPSEIIFSIISVNIFALSNFIYLAIESAEALIKPFLCSSRSPSRSTSSPWRSTAPLPTTG